MSFSDRNRWHSVIALAMCAMIGCGTTKKQHATEQLVLSDAVDQAIAKLDFTYFRDQSVFLDSQYIRNVKGLGFVNADYITSSLRQQIAAYGCKLQDSAEKADYVLEARVGALGADNNTFSFGIPSSQGFSEVTSLMQNAPPIPTIPEISFARRDDQRGAAKIGVFAYHRATREPVWQASLSRGKSTAKDSWFFGAGPFRGGTINSRVRFDGLAISDDVELTEEQRTKYFAGRSNSQQRSSIGIATRVPAERNGVSSTGQLPLDKPEEPASKVVPATFDKKAPPKPFPAEKQK